jgi:hypothetical protein
VEVQRRPQLEEEEQVGGLGEEKLPHQGQNQRKNVQGKAYLLIW